MKYYEIPVVKMKELAKAMNDPLTDLIWEADEEVICRIVLDTNYYDCDDNGAWARIARYFEEHPACFTVGADYVYVEVEEY